MMYEIMFCEFLCIHIFIYLYILQQPYKSGAVIFPIVRQSKDKEVKQFSRVLSL